MRVCKCVRSTFVAFVLLFGLGSFAWADEVAFHSNLCNPAAMDVSKVNYNQFGVHNTSPSSSALVTCGTALSFPPVMIEDAKVIVYDRNPEPGNDVTCTLVLAGKGGNTIWSGTRSSSGSMADFQELSFTPLRQAYTVSLQCSIPPTTSQGVSHVTNYYLVYSP